MKETLKHIAIGLVLIFAVIGISITATIAFSGESIYMVFTDDYIKAQKQKLDAKYEAFRDSMANNINNPAKYNRFVDSSNRVESIYNYMKKP